MSQVHQYGGILEVDPNSKTIYFHSKLGMTLLRIQGDRSSPMPLLNMIDLRLRLKEKEEYEGSMEINFEKNLILFRSEIGHILLKHEKEDIPKAPLSAQNMIDIRIPA